MEAHYSASCIPADLEHGWDMYVRTTGLHGIHQAGSLFGVLGSLISPHKSALFAVDVHQGWKWKGKAGEPSIDGDDYILVRKSARDAVAACVALDCFTKKSEHKEAPAIKPAGALESAGQ